MYGKGKRRSPSSSYKEVGREVNTDKKKYMVISGEQTAGLSHTMKVDNSSIERVEEFKYFGRTLTNQNSILEEDEERRTNVW